MWLLRVQPQCVLHVCVVVWCMCVHVCPCGGLTFTCRSPHNFLRQGLTEPSDQLDLLSLTVTDVSGHGGGKDKAVQITVSKK